MPSHKVLAAWPKMLADGVTQDSWVLGTSGATMYVSMAQLDNNLVGEVNSKTPQPPWSVGDTMDVTITERNGVNKFKMSKPGGNQFRGGGGGGGGKPRDNSGQMVGAAMNNAVMLFSKGLIPWEDIEIRARELADISVKVQNDYKGKV